MPSSYSHLFAASEEPLRALPMPPLAFGALAFLGFMAMLGVLWFFRGTAQKIALGVGHGHDAHGTGAAGHDNHDPRGQQGSHH
ncbi:MAG TPA: hypothetical protein VGN19_06925 [Pedococcus sp.]|jgi:hypothetical protein|nr:hypothetical protein [Pedococcus sp.]